MGPRRRADETSIGDWSRVGTKHRFERVAGTPWQQALLSDMAAAAPAEAADLDGPLDYFAALLVRARSEEVLGWGADDFANALRWCAYWEARVAGTGGAAVGGSRGR